jgi:hypothetical protein
MIINDPIDTDSETKEFIKEVIKHEFGEATTFRRSTYKEDVEEGIDIYVIKMDDEIATQVKTHNQVQDYSYDLNVHLAYKNKAGNNCAFDVYNSRTKLKLFMFVWPRMRIAVLTEYKPMMAVWNKHNKQWKTKWGKQGEGYYVAIPLYNFIRTFKKGDVKEIKL